MVLRRAARIGLRGLSLLWLLAWLGVPAAESRASFTTPSLAIDWVPAAEPAGAVFALAFDVATRQLAVVDHGAVWVGPARGTLAPVQRARGVREVAFDGSGALWIAGETGLTRWHAGHSSEELKPAGEGIVTRIRGAGGFWMAAASDGLHLRRPAGDWSRVDLPVPAGPVTALAVARSDAGLRLALVIRGEAHWLQLEDAGSPVPRTRDWKRVGVAGTGGRSAADVWLDDGGQAGWTLLRDGCLVGPREASCAPLPPGSKAERLFRVDRRWWVTTARGLLVAEAPTGPWRREPPPLGSSQTYAVVGGAGEFFAGTERGLLVSRLPSAALAASPVGSLADLPPAFRSERREPRLEEVRRAALDYLDLGAARLRGMRDGASRRGWLPTLAIRVDRDHVSSRRDDFDEAFLSGALRSTFDREEDRATALEASVSLQWDLGDVLYHPESVDVSRETRALVELRDDVLDEIHHLYFERRRVILELFALPAGQPLAAARLRLRADELAAGIDAWTGGWFGRHTARLAP